MNDSQVEQFRVRPKIFDKKYLSDRTNVLSWSTKVEPMKTERARINAEAYRTRPNGWPSLPEQHQLALVRVESPLLNECLDIVLVQILSFVCTDSLRHSYLNPFSWVLEKKNKTKKKRNPLYTIFNGEIFFQFSNKSVVEHNLGTNCVQ